MSRPRAVVIGAGVAGLASAALLAREGYDVEVLEQRSTVGGRAGSWDSSGFRFDTGPSWYLMPEVFDHFFQLLGTSAAEQLELAVLDPGYRVFFEGHAEPVDVHRDLSRTVATFEDIEPGAGRALQAYLASAGRTYRMAMRRFLYTTFASPAALAAPDVLVRGPRLARLLTQTLDRFIAGHVTDRRLVQVLGYPAVFLGSSPDRAPSMYHLMSHLDLVDGVHYPRGGFARVIEAIAGLAEREGARIRTGATVTAITTGGEGARQRRPGLRLPGSPRCRVTGVRFRDTDGRGQATAADIVVGAADLHHVETQLLPARLQTYPQAWWDRRQSGPGAVLVHLGVQGRLPQLPHHSLFFTADWKQNFEHIFGSDPRVPEPASVYVCTPSRTDPQVAPPGSENLFLLVPVPADTAIGCGGIDGGGDPAVEKVADAAIDQISSWADIPDLRQRVLVRRTVGPADFARDFNAWSGGALGPAHVLRQSAFLRGRNASRKVAGLYYAGHSTIPGIGLPMCLISAELVIKRLRGDRSSGPLPAPLR